MGSRNKLLNIKIILLIVALLFAIKWAINPSGIYEPYIVLAGTVLAIIEFIRERLIKQTQSKKTSEHTMPYDSTFEFKITITKKNHQNSMPIYKS